MDIPGDLLYTSDHEWVRAQLDAQGDATTVTIGITAYASDALGDVVFVDLPDAKTSVQASESMGEVESTKSVSDLYAPVSGTIITINEALADSPGLVNSDPYGQGWLCEIEVANAIELDALLNASSYKELTGE